MATAVEVMSAYEVETFLLYCADDVVHRVAGTAAFRGEGRGRDALRGTMVRTLRSFLGGFTGRAARVHPGPQVVAVEWEGTARATGGPSQEYDGLFLLEHRHEIVHRLRGHVTSRRPPSGEVGEGEDVDEDGNQNRHREEEEDGDLR